MGFGEAFINIVLLTQKYLNPPVIYDRNSDKVATNPKLKSILKMLPWYVGNCFIAAVHVFSVIHLILLLMQFHDINAASKAAKEEAFVYIFTVVITAEAIFTWRTMEKDSAWIAGVEAQIFTAFRIKYRGWPNSERRPDIFEISAYGMAIAFGLFPFATIVLPIIRSYDPINLMFETFIPISVDPKLQKATVIVAYLLSVSFGAMSCLNMLILTMTHCYALSMAAKESFISSRNCINLCPSIRRSTDKNAVINVNNFLTSYEIRHLQRVFQKKYSAYVQFRFMITGINIGLDWFIPATTGVGMSVCVASNYGLIDLYGRLPKILEANMAVTTVGISILLLHLLLYASLPLTYSELLIHLWKKIKMGRLERRQIRAMIPVGFAMGQYFSVKKRTALDIMDTILNGTVTVLVG